MSKQQKTVLAALGVIAVVMVVLMVWAPSRYSQPSGGSVSTWSDRLSAALGDLMSAPVAASDLRARSPGGVCRLTRTSDGWRLEVSAGNSCLLEVRPAQTRLRRLTASLSAGSGAVVALTPKRQGTGATVKKTIRRGGRGYEMSIQEPGAELDIRALGSPVTLSLH